MIKATKIGMFNDPARAGLPTITFFDDAGNTLGTREIELEELANPTDEFYTKSGEPRTKDSLLRRLLEKFNQEQNDKLQTSDRTDQNSPVPNV